MYFTVILAVILKSAIFILSKKLICPILPLKINYLRDYLEPKNYLEVPEWQDDSWSGNCLVKTLPVLGRSLPTRNLVFEAWEARAG